MLKYTSPTAHIVIIHAHVKGSPENSCRVRTPPFPLAREGGYFRNFSVGMCRWTLEPLTYTRAGSAEFYYPILE